MVAGYLVARSGVSQCHDAIVRFVATTCQTRQLDRSQQLAIFVHLGSNSGATLAAEIAGLDWVDRNVGDRVMAEYERAAAIAKWQSRGTRPPDWPFAIIGDGSFAIWVAPSDSLPAHLAWLWNNASWLWNDDDEMSAPERPAGAVPCVVEYIGHWRLWLLA